MICVIDHWSVLMDRMKRRRTVAIVGQKSLSVLMEGSAYQKYGNVMELQTVWTDPMNFQVVAMAADQTNLPVPMICGVLQDMVCVMENGIVMMDRMKLRRTVAT